MKKNKPIRRKPKGWIPIVTREAIEYGLTVQERQRALELALDALRGPMIQKSATILEYAGAFLKFMGSGAA